MDLHTKAKKRGELLTPFGRRPIGPTVPLAGCKGREVLLSVLQVLQGVDPGIIRPLLLISTYPPYLSPTEIRSLLKHFDAPRIAEQSMFAMMRELTDLWIDSGKSGVDRQVDTPTERNVEDLPPGHKQPLGELYFSFLQGHVPWPEMWRSGRQTRGEMAIKFESQEIEKRGWKGAFEHFGQKTAVQWFARLLNSRYARNLARCDRCGVYFATERVRRKPSRSGAFCVEHRASGSRVRNRSWRARHKAAMVDVAAKAWMDWKKSNRTPNQREWVAQVVNRSFGTVFTKRWVSQEKNLTVILERVEALAHAKL
jgi:hypothetical protein